MNAIIQTGHRFDQDMTGVANAFVDAGIRCMMWSEANRSAFSVFEEVKPDIFIGATSLLTRALRKCLEAHKPKTAMFVDEENEAKDIPEQVSLLMSYNILQGETSPNIPRLKLWPCVNINVSLGHKEDDSMKSEILYVGGFNGPTKPLINKYIIPLAQDYKLRIFGTGGWTLPNCLGILSYANMKNAMFNTKLYAYLTGQEDDLSWGPFQAMMAGVPTITNNKNIIKLFSNYHPNLVYEFGHDDISEILANKEDLAAIGFEAVTKNHTNYHCAFNLLKGLGIDEGERLFKALDKRIQNG